MYNFAVITDKVSYGTKPINSYGVRVSKNEEVLINFNNITFEKNVIIKFTELCNKHQISPIHFDDVLENFLTDFETF